MTSRRDLEKRVDDLEEIDEEPDNLAEIILQEALADESA